MNENVGAKKPLGIVLIAVYSAFSGVLFLLFGAVTMFAAQVSAWFSLLASALMVVGALLIASCYGLWTLQPWGLKTARAIYAVSIPLGFVAMLPDRTAGNIVLQLIGIGIDVWVLVYLAKSTTKSIYSAE